LLQLYLDRQANINVAKVDGFTPLHLAGKKGNILVVKWLLEWVPM
jgi:ankyrin repeat protein